jgi:hypothetical protein
MHGALTPYYFVPSLPSCSTGGFGRYFKFTGMFLLVIVQNNKRCMVDVLKCKGTSEGSSACWYRLGSSGILLKWKRVVVRCHRHLRAQYRDRAMNKGSLSAQWEVHSAVFWWYACLQQYELTLFYTLLIYWPILSETKYTIYSHNNCNN